MDKIFDTINIYYKVATLLGDMAHRTMYSLIPGGKFDLMAARWIAKGAMDIIYYGTRTVMDELRHYRGPRQHDGMPIEFDSLEIDELPSLKNLDLYINNLQIAKSKYDDYENWNSAYGGKNWANITKTLINICKTYKELLTIKRDSSFEESALRRMIILLNVFDGLCHNTGSVYNKMIIDEGHDDGTDPFEISERKDLVNRIRDLTELKDPKHLYNEVKDLVYPRSIYKDYETQIRNAPGFYDPADVESQLKKVNVRKGIKLDLQYHINDIMKDLMKIEKAINELKSAGLGAGMVLQKISFVRLHVEDILSTLGSLRSYINNNVEISILLRSEPHLNEQKARIKYDISVVQEWLVKVMDYVWASTKSEDKAYKSDSTKFSLLMEQAANYTNRLIDNINGLIHSI